MEKSIDKQFVEKPHYQILRYEALIINSLPNHIQNV